MKPITFEDICSCEPLTETLIFELIKKGFPKESMPYFIDNGYLYCRKRNSFLQPYEDTGVFKNILKKQ